MGSASARRCRFLAKRPLVYKKLQLLVEKLQSILKSYRWLFTNSAV